MKTLTIILTFNLFFLTSFCQTKTPKYFSLIDTTLETGSIFEINFYYSKDDTLMPVNFIDEQLVDSLENLFKTNKNTVIEFYLWNSSTEFDTIQFSILRRLIDSLILKGVNKDQIVFSNGEYDRRRYVTQELAKQYQFLTPDTYLTDLEILKLKNKKNQDITKTLNRRIVLTILSNNLSKKTIYGEKIKINN